MRTTTIVAITGALLGADACFIRCTDGSKHDVGAPRHLVCPGQQAYITAAPGYADIVFFDGRPNSCVDSKGFSLLPISENVVGCGNGVTGRCCGRNRC